jgi:hypothetical protein
MYYKLDCPRVCFDVFEGGPLPSLYGPEGRVTDLETNLSWLQLPYKSQIRIPNLTDQDLA